jgi:hypothetical protein
MNSRISPIRVELLRILICSEPTILSKVQIRNGAVIETPKKVQIKENGTAYFYYGHGPIWWQRCCNSYESVSIIDASIRIADAITGSNGSRNDIAFDGITKSILDKAVKERDFDCVVDILFDSMRNCSDGELHSKYINQENAKKYAEEQREQYKHEYSLDGDVEIGVGVDLGGGRILPIIGKLNNKIVKIRKG